MNNSNIKIRHANESDIDSLLVDLKEFAKFYGSQISLLGSDEEYSRAALKVFIDNHVFLIAENDEGMMGFISGIKSPHIYNPAIDVLMESFWWVKPECRKSGAGLILLERFIEIGKENADWVICTIEENSPISENVFLDRGFRLKEKSYIMEIDRG